MRTYVNSELVPWAQDWEAAEQVPTRVTFQLSFIDAGVSTTCTDWVYCGRTRPQGQDRAIPQKGSSLIACRHSAGRMGSLSRLYRTLCPVRN